MGTGLSKVHRPAPPPMPYDVTDRRPIAARKLRIMDRAAELLAGLGVSPNAISIVGLLLAIAAAAALLATRHTDTLGDRVLWAVVILGVQGRLLCNLFDGMVAIKRHVASAVGELFNEVPDRISDVAVLACLGYVEGGSPLLGWLAALAAVATAYIRVTGKSLGLPSDFCGPMAKQQRMFLVTVLGLCGVIVPSWMAAYHLPAWTAGIIAVGALLTCGRRLLRIARGLRARAAGGDA